MKSNRLFFLAVVNLLASVVFPVTPAFSQNHDNVIEWSKSPIGSNNERVAASLQLVRQIDGVEIEDIAVEGKSITVGKPFAAADDWLKTITFRVRNISGRRLVSVQITVVLPEMNNRSPDVVFCYGCALAEKERLMPGEVVELKMLGGEFYDWVRSRIAEQGSAFRISKAEIHHMYVTPTYRSPVVQWMC
ncbi:MAG: hypothetical protein AABN95_25185 [Acidobacteriota bacterium]